MTKQQDFYWSVSKDEFMERNKRLGDTYSVSIWNYLQAFIIRGEVDIPLWKVCHNLYEVSGLLAANISINRMSKDLNMSYRTIIRRLEELDRNNHIIKYVSKTDTGKINNTNIYILGINNVGTEREGNITRDELYFVNRTIEMRKKDRKHITELFDRQIEIENMIKETTEELKEISERLFRRVVPESQ